jgi:hypothetical protein
MSIANTILFAVQVQFAGGLNAGCNAPITQANLAQGTTATISAYPTYVYNVTDLSGNPLGTNMTPTKPRRGGPQSSGQGIGIGYYDQNSAFQLWDANEFPQGKGQG